MISTPICDFVQSYTARQPVRFHMPGHKGVPFLGCEALDITEIEGADDLAHAESIILQSEQQASAHFGSAHTFYSTGGSSQSIRAMLFLAMQFHHTGTEQPFLLAGRNAHKSFLHACALLDLQVGWLMPSQDAPSLCSCPLTAQNLTHALQSAPRKPFAVYVTSPDYLGGTLDIAALSQVCAHHHVPLLVDNAHGAYLKFLPQSQHPLDLGATMCCDSAHKTLPVLTGGGYLHINATASMPYASQARNALSLFGSTSPSYLILQSLDRCNAYLDRYPHALAETLAHIAVCKRALTAQGWLVCASDPLRITLHVRPLGMRGQDLSAQLHAHNIVVEFVDADYLVLMCTPENACADFDRLVQALGQAPHLTAVQVNAPPLPVPQSVCSIRRALFAPQQTIAVADAVGRICAAPAVSCPPAIPLAVSGERMTADLVAVFAHYGIESVSVLAQAL